MAGGRAAGARGSGIWGASFGHSSSQLATSSEVITGDSRSLTGEDSSEDYRQEERVRRPSSHPLAPQPPGPASSPGLTRRLFSGSLKERSRKSGLAFVSHRALLRRLGTRVRQGYWRLSSEPAVAPDPHLQAPQVGKCLLTQRGLHAEFCL